MTKILLTGASGFIGKGLATDLREKGFEVIGTSHRSAGDGLVICDLTDPAQVSKLPHADVIIHLAQATCYKDYPNKANSIFNVNVASTQYLLEFARQNNAKKFIFMSTGSVYDLSLNVEITETSPIKPNSYYATTKLMAEQLVNCYSEFFQCISLRLFNPFSHIGNGKLISNIFEKVERGSEIYIANDVGVLMNPLYLKDLNDALIAVVKSNIRTSDVFNLAGAEATTLKDFALMYSDVIKSKPKFQKTNEKTVNMVANVEKFKEVFSFEFKYSLQKALKEVCATRTF